MEIDADENPKLRSEKKRMKKRRKVLYTYIVWSQGEIENNFNAIRITTTSPKQNTHNNTPRIIGHGVIRTHYDDYYY